MSLSKSADNDEFFIGRSLNVTHSVEIAGLPMFTGSTIPLVAFQFRHVAGVAQLAERRETDARKTVQTTVVDMYTSQGLIAGEQGDRAQAALWFGNAIWQARKEDPERERYNRLRFHTWSQGLPMPTHALAHHGQWLKKICFDPTGQYLFALSTDGECTIWNLTTKRQLMSVVGQPISSAAWNPVRTSVAMGLKNRVEIWEIPSRRRLQTIEHPGTISALTFNADGHLLALASESARVWDFKKGGFTTPHWFIPNRLFGSPLISRE